MWESVSGSVSAQLRFACKEIGDRSGFYFCSPADLPSGQSSSSNTLSNSFYEGALASFAIYLIAMLVFLLPAPAYGTYLYDLHFTMIKKFLKATKGYQRSKTTAATTKDGECCTPCRLLHHLRVAFLGKIRPLLTDYLESTTPHHRNSNDIDWKEVEEVVDGSECGGKSLEDEQKGGVSENPIISEESKDEATDNSGTDLETTDKSDSTTPDNSQIPEYEDLQSTSDCTPVADSAVKSVDMTCEAPEADKQDSTRYSTSGRDTFLKKCEDLSRDREAHRLECEALNRRLDSLEMRLQILKSKKLNRRSYEPSESVSEEEPESRGCSKTESDEAIGSSSGYKSDVDLGSSSESDSEEDIKSSREYDLEEEIESCERSELGSDEENEPSSENGSEEELESCSGCSECDSDEKLESSYEYYSEDDSELGSYGCTECGSDKIGSSVDSGEEIESCGQHNSDEELDFSSEYYSVEDSDLEPCGCSQCDSDEKLESSLEYDSAEELESSGAHDSVEKSDPGAGNADPGLLSIEVPSSSVKNGPEQEIADADLDVISSHESNIIEVDEISDCASESEPESSESSGDILNEDPYGLSPLIDPFDDGYESSNNSRESNASQTRKDDIVASALPTISYRPSRSDTHRRLFGYFNKVYNTGHVDGDSAVEDPIRGDYLADLSKFAGGPVARAKKTLAELINRADYLADSVAGDSLARAGKNLAGDSADGEGSAGGDYPDGYSADGEDSADSADRESESTGPCQFETDECLDEAYESDSDEESEIWSVVGSEDGSDTWSEVEGDYGSETWSDEVDSDSE